MLKEQLLPNFFLHTFVESPIPTVVANKTQFLFANASFLSFSQYDANEINQLNFNLITPNNVNQQHHEGYFSSSTHLKHKIDERYIRRKHGQVVLVELSYVLHIFESEPYIVFFIRDISQYKTKNEKLYANEKRLTLALKASNQAIWDWNNITGETFYSDDYFSMLGYEPNEFIPSYDKWVSLLHPEDKEIATYSQQLYMESKADNYAIDFRLQTKDQSYIWTHTQAIILSRDIAGNAERILGIVMNINEQKKKEKALRDLTQKLVQFAFYHSHILRSPVARALGLVQLMKQDENPLYFQLVEKSIAEIDEIILSMNLTLSQEVNLSAETSILFKKITFISKDKISQYIHKQLVDKIKTNVKASFNEDFNLLLEEPEEAGIVGHIVIVDMQISNNDIWLQIEKIQQSKSTVSIFLLADMVTIEEILKAKEYPIIKGILLKPLSFENMNELFS